ncbi:MAG: type III secretion protein, partial [Proteobacteria bacterium]|nr:type III secretion protein [Pseudomonadota bacterium]
MSAVELFFHALICGLRPLGMLIVLPLGWDLLGVSARITIAASLAAFSAPFVPPLVHCTFADCLGELVLGMLIALPAALLIECASNAGELFDTLRGQTIASVLDPLQQEVLSLSAILAKWTVWTLILTNGTALELAVGVVHSFSSVPPGAVLVGGIQEVGWKVLLYVPSLLKLTMTACLPFAFACIAVETLLAFISKQLPSLS